MIDSSKLIATLEKIAALTRGANALCWADQIDYLNNNIQLIQFTKFT